MKKIIIYILLTVCLCFVLPILFTSGFGSKQVDSKQIAENKITENTYNYKDYDSIKLLHSKTNEIEDIKLDTYLYGVVANEMPADFEMEALKAQAVVARTYTIYKITHPTGKHPDASICDASTCCQAWTTKEERLEKWEESTRQNNWDKIVEAVNSTQGKIITYNNEPIDAFFHANSGGVTELPINVWGGENYPYLQTVQTAGEEGYKQYSSQVSVSKDELFEKVKEKHNELQIDWNMQDCIKITEYTDSKRVKTIKIGNVTISGTEARTIFALKSTNFEVKIDGDAILFDVKGYGHGVGMSQTGADSMAKAGSKYEEIIKHFYVGVEIKDM